MVEPIMYIGIGFLVAGLLVIGVIPLVHARAVRLTVRRLEASTPLSMAEIQAEKDQLRAEFAMAMSRLEMTVEQMKVKTTSQLAEIGRKSEAVGRLKFELGEKTAAVLALEAKEKQLIDDVHNLQAELAAKTHATEQAQLTLGSAQTELAQANTRLHEGSVATESQRVELAALRAHSEVLHNEIDSYEKEITELRDRLGRKTAEATALAQQLGEERGRLDQLISRGGELEQTVTAQATESEGLGRRVQELTAQLEEHGRSLADRESAVERLHNEANTARETEGELRALLTELENRYRSTTETLATEKALIESELKRSHDERDKLQRELATIKREAQNAAASEGMENAALRERINDVAAEVVRLTASLEGPGSPIEAILKAGHAAAAPAGANGASPPSAVRAEESKGTLADRISALQGPAAPAPRSGAEPESGRSAGRSAQRRR